MTAAEAPRTATPAVATARQGVPPRRPPRPGTRPARLELVTAVPGAFFALYLAVGLVRFNAGGTGNYDLGIFAQAAQRWSEGRLPGSNIRSLDNLFADHFSPITAVFGLGWLIWPDPRSLIVLQALALAGALLFVCLAAFAHLPTWWALPLVVAAGLSKGIVSAAAFDVHEAAFGALLISGLCWGLLASRRGVVIGCAAGLLLVKEDLGLTVAAAGLVWLLLRRNRRTPALVPTGLLPPPLRPDRRTALLLIAIGTTGLLVANGVVAWVNPDHQSPYLQFLLGSSGNPQGLSGAVVGGGNRLAPGLLFLAALGLVGLRSPIALLAVPTLAWRVLSSNASYWQTYFHYDAILVPIATFALIDVLRRRHPVRAYALIAAAGLSYATWQGVAKLSARPIWDPGAYHLSATMGQARALSGLIPRGAPVAAQQNLGPMLLSRADVHMLDAVEPARVRWVMLTEQGSQLGADQAAKGAWLAAQRRRPGVQVLTRGAVTLVRLPTEEPVRLPG